MTNEEFTEQVRQQIRSMGKNSALIYENAIIREEFTGIVPVIIDRNSVLYQKLAGKNLSWVAAYGASWKIERDRYGWRP